jgi:hypothetical protein
LIFPKWQTVHTPAATYAKDPYDNQRYSEIMRLAAEIISQYSAATLERLESGFEGELGYATPKVDVRAAVFREGRVLMVRERQEGLWTLPGGWADVGESPG